MKNHLDEDWNVSAMRETAARIGLQDLIVKAYRSTDARTTKALLLRALRLLGVRFQKGKKS